MSRTKKYTNLVDIPTGLELQKMQKESGIPVFALSRMTHIKPSSIYRAFKDVETKESTRLLLYIALTNTEVLLK